MSTKTTEKAITDALDVDEQLAKAKAEVEQRQHDVEKLEQQRDELAAKYEAFGDLKKYPQLTQSQQLEQENTARKIITLDEEHLPSARKALEVAEAARAEAQLTVQHAKDAFADERVKESLRALLARREALEKELGEALARHNALRAGPDELFPPVGTRDESGHTMTALEVFAKPKPGGQVALRLGLPWEFEKLPELPQTYSPTPLERMLPEDQQRIRKVQSKEKAERSQHAEAARLHKQAAAKELIATADRAHAGPDHPARKRAAQLLAEADA